MGNHKFRFSDMMPNAWFYKLRDMSRTRKHPNTSHSTKKKQSSLYFSNTSKRANRFDDSPVHSESSDSHILENPPGKSLINKRAKRKTIYRPSPKTVSSSSVSAGCSSHARISSVRAHDKNSNLYNKDSSDLLLSALETSSESFLSDFNDGGDDFAFPPWFDDHIASSRSSDCKFSSSTTDIIIDMNKDAYTRKKFDEIDKFDTISELELPPILTKTEKFSYRSTQIKDIKKRPACHEVTKEKEQESISRTQKKHPKPISAGRKSSASSSGIRLRVNSPKIQVTAQKSVSSSRSKGISDSFAVVKSSVDPQRDFRESMVEMIAENNIRASKDLENLLACYLSLNADEYHDLIVEAFKQIWFDMKNLHQ